MGRVATAAALAAVLIFSLAAPAAAHDETGEFSAVQAEPNGDGTYTVDVLLTFTNDGHGAADAPVTVTANGQPVTMQPGDREGAYTGEVALDPGTATFVATSTDPVAERTFTVEVPTATTTTAGSPVIVSPTTILPTTTTEAAADEDSGGSGKGLLYLALLLAGVGVGIGVVFWQRNRQ